MFWRNGGVQKLQQKLGRETPSGFFHVSFLSYEPLGRKYGVEAAGLLREEKKKI